MPINLVQASTGGVGGGTTTTANFATAPVQGNLLTASVNTVHVTGTPVSPTIPGWTAISEIVNGTNTTLTRFTRVAGASEPTAIPVTSSTNSQMKVQALEFSGVDTAVPGVVSTNTNTGASTSQAAGAAGDFVVVPGDLLIGAWGTRGSSPTGITVDNGFNLVTAANRLSLAYLIVTAAGTINPTLSWTSGTAAGGASLVKLKAVPTGAPTNTVAPAITGTPQAGSTLTVSDGTWDQSGTTSYQWQSDVSGVWANATTGTANTHVVNNPGNNRRCLVTRTNGSGQATTVASNVVAIAPAPTNTVAPVITTDGTPANGETISVDTGSWTGSGLTYSYQWLRTVSGNTTPISGATSATYLLASADEGNAITCRVTAAGAGTTTQATSNSITPAVTAPIDSTNLVTYMTGGAGNNNGSASLGGASGAALTNVQDLLIGPIPGTVGLSGGVFYRVLNVKNTHINGTAANLRAFVEAQFPAGCGVTVAVAVATEAANTLVAPLASATTAPTGVTWVTTTDPSAGADFGSLAPGAFRGYYVRFTVAANSPVASNLAWSTAVEGIAA